MYRLVLAVLVVALVLALLAAAITALRRSLRTESAPGGDAGFGEDAMQKLAFFLLVALILYVSVTGGV